MVENSLISGKFAEELYFLLMSSALRDRVIALGAKHGITDRALRNEIIAFGDQMGNRADFSMKETIYVPRKLTG
jgi:hypothetical protein